MVIRVGRILHDSYVDAPGRRSVLFVQGCSLGCLSCQSPHLWSKEGGQPIEVSAAAGALLSGARQTQGLPNPRLTISGGEPFDQAEALAELVTRLRQEGAGHIAVYSGYTWEELQARPAAQAALAQIDVLVDGRYRIEQDSPWIQYRGSANQRVIDVPATLREGRLVLLNWDRPEIIVTHDGQLIATTPVMALVQAWGIEGQAALTRRCGQSR